MDRDVPVLPYRKVLVPFDGSAGSSKALRRALLLAKDSGAEVVVLTVDEHLPRYAPGVGEVDEYSELRAGYFAEVRAQAEALAAEQGITIQAESAVGHAAQTIIRRAGEGSFDLIVIGHSGHSGVWGTLLGSTTARVVDQARCDVLVVR